MNLEKPPEDIVTPPNTNHSEGALENSKKLETSLQRNVKELPPVVKKMAQNYRIVTRNILERRGGRKSCAKDMFLRAALVAQRTAAESQLSISRRILGLIKSDKGEDSGSKTTV